MLVLTMILRPAGPARRVEGQGRSAMEGGKRRSAQRREPPYCVPPSTPASPSYHSPPGRAAGGAGSKMRCCCWGGSVEYRGYTLMGPTASPMLFTCGGKGGDRMGRCCLKGKHAGWTCRWHAGAAECVCHVQARHRAPPGEGGTRTSLTILRHASSISSSPVRNTRMSPGGSAEWICTTVRMAASR